MEIRIEKISKKFKRGRREITVLDEVSALIPAKAFTLVTGDSGAGKSTLLNIISGLISSDGGSIFLDDLDLTTLSDKRLSELRQKKFGIVTQTSDLISYLTLEENLDVALKITGKKEGNKDDLLEKLGLLDLKDSYPDEMSGGEIKRAAIVRSLITEPEVVIMDEPTANLDRQNVRKVLALLKEYKDKGKSVIISSHEAEAKEYCDVLIELERGRV